MFKRRALDITEDILQGEQGVHEAIHKLISARTKSHAQLLKWASGEENSLILSLFRRLTEIQWIYNEATKEMAEKHLQLTKALRRIFQKEKQLDEMRKELQGSESKKAKLQKQIDGASKKGDQVKVQSLEAELSNQITVCDHLMSSSETKAQKLELYKLTQIKKALVCQAEGVITLCGHCQQLYASQMQLIDLLPDSLSESTDKKDEIEFSMSSVVGKVSELLNSHPPPSGGLDQETTTSSESNEKSHLLLSVGLPKRHKSAENLLSVSGEGKHVPRVSEVMRPEVNYTQGMYCEIVIPDLASKSAPKVHTKGVPMRRSQSGSSPVVNRKVLEQKHRSAIVTDQEQERPEGLGDSVPLDNDWDNSSTPDSSSDDLEPDKGYARLTIISSPTGLRSSSVSPDVDHSDDYAKPVDVVPFKVGNFRDQQRKMRRTVPASPPIPEVKSVPMSQYETIEDIRKLKKEQADKRKGVQNDTKKNRDDEHVYSRPFDAVSFNQPLRVSVDSSRNQLSVASRSNGKLVERAAKILHQTSPRGSSENLPESLRAGSGRTSDTKTMNTSQSDSSLPPAPLPLTKTQSFPPEDSAPVEDDQTVLRTSSVGSMRNFPLPPKPVAAKTRNLRTGQATVITSGGSRKPVPKPKPIRQ